MATLTQFNVGPEMWCFCCKKIIHSIQLAIKVKTLPFLHNFVSLLKWNSGLVDDFSSVCIWIDALVNTTKHHLCSLIEFFNWNFTNVCTLGSSSVLSVGPQGTNISEISMDNSIKIYKHQWNVNKTGYLFIQENAIECALQSFCPSFISFHTFIMFWCALVICQPCLNCIA